MDATKTIKAITLSGFIVLISGFIAYRTGAFNDNTPDTAEETTLAEQSINSLNVNPVDSPETAPTMMSSSKSIMVVPEKKSNAPKPPVKNKKQPAKKTTDSVRVHEMMGGSKSGIIFRPDPVTDTAKADPK